MPTPLTDLELDRAIASREIAGRRHAAWVNVVQYILTRTREPSLVHRGVQAVMGIIAAWELPGPERWVALILGVSALIGILMPDALDKPPPEPPEPLGWDQK